jgi:hypothetical protein
MRWLGLVIFVCLLAAGSLVQAANPPPVPVGQALGEAMLRVLSGLDVDRALSLFRLRPLLIDVEYAGFTLSDQFGVRLRTVGIDAIQ